MKTKLIVPVLAFLLLASSAAAQDWMVQYLKTGVVQPTAPVYPNGSYEFVRAPDYVPVYLRRADIWDFIGMYGAPFNGHPQASLPGTFPVIAFPGGSDFAIATPVTGVPELAILRSFTKHIGGRQLNAAVNPMLQRITAWGAVKLLGAKSVGVYVVMPNVILEVQEWCSGVSSMKWLMLLALGLGLVSRIGLPWTAALVVAAAMIGLEANMLRVAGVGYGYDKELLGWGALALGVGQVLGLGLVMNRRAH
jgi:exosortase/archaeosortase family protein